MTEIKDRIHAILRDTGRPGIEDVITYIGKSSYFWRGAGSHHKERGGLARHSLEVYEHMMAHTSHLPADSIAVAALLHDLGKTAKHNDRGHEQQGVDILDRLGFALTPAERTAIARHGSVSLDFLTCPLRRALSCGDMWSTGRWKHAHRKQTKKHNGRK